MKKRLAAAALALLMALSLAGCRKEPVTAESLVAGVPEIDPAKYSNIAVAVAVGTGGEDSSDGMVLVMGVESAGSIRHIYDAEATIGSGEDSMTIGIEGWSDAASGTVYTSLSYGGFGSGWSKSAGGADSTVMDASGAASSITEIWKGADFRLSEEGSDSHYIVEWDVSAEAMSEAAGDLGGTFDPDSFGSMSGTASFDRKSRELEGIEVRAENADGGRFLFYVEFYEINGDKTLEIPAEIVETAVDGDDPASYGPVDTGRGWYTYDDGSDEYIDGAADRMGAWVTDEGWVLANHYDSFSQMAMDDDRDGWVCSMDLQRARAEDYPDLAKDTYASEVEWCDEAYGHDNLVFGSGTEALYIVGHKTLVYTALVDENTVVAVEVTMDGDPDDDVGAIGALDEMLAAAGLPERGAP